MRRGYDGYGVEIEALAGEVMWNHWTRRLRPWQELTVGDTVYLLDDRTRRLVAELQVNGSIHTAYDSLDESWEQLEAAFGVTQARWSGYEPPVGPGFLLAFDLNAVRALDIAFDVNWAHLGGHNGFIALDTFIASERIDPAVRTSILDALPAPGATPVAWAPANDLAGFAHQGPYRPSRCIPMAVRRAVLARSAGTCEWPGCSAPGAHFDHIVPVSKGGNGALVNVQWLCSPHNLAKSDRMPENWLPEQLFVDFVCCDEDLPWDDFTIGTELTAMRIRTRNSTYDVVCDDDIVLVNKPATRVVHVGRRPADPVAVTGKPLFVGDDDGDGLRTSPIETVEQVDPVPVLAALGYRPGSEVKVRRRALTDGLAEELLAMDVVQRGKTIRDLLRTPGLDPEVIAVLAEVGYTPLEVALHPNTRAETLRKVAEDPRSLNALLLEALARHPNLPEDLRSTLGQPDPDHDEWYESCRVPDPEDHDA